MRRLIKLAALAGLTGLITTQPGMARDPFVGGWGGTCDGAIQCRLEIQKSGDDYLVSFVVADRFDHTKEFCRINSNMTRGTILYSVHESFDDALGGLFQDSPAYLAPSETDGSLYYGGGIGGGLACGKYLHQGSYYFFGD